MTDAELAGNYLYETWNETEHANRMVEGARAFLDQGDTVQAIADLKIARGAAERAVSKMRRALEVLATVDGASPDEAKP